MPPPLLSRHLRPCQYPWTARQVRCSPTTSRAHRSAAGDKRPGILSPTGGSENHDAGTQPSTSARVSAQDAVERAPDAQKSKNGLWEAVKQSIKTFSSQETPHEAPEAASKPTVALPNSPVPKEIPPTTKNLPPIPKETPPTTGEIAPEPTKIPLTPGETPHTRRKIPPTTRDQSPTHPARAGKKIAKAAEDKGRQEPTPRPSIARPLEKHIPKSDPHGEPQEQPPKVAHANKGNLDAATLEEENRRVRRASLQWESSPDLRGETKPVVLQHLKQLAEQVRTLQAMLEEKSEEHTSDLQPSPHVPKPQSRVLQAMLEEKTEKHTTDLQPSSHVVTSQSRAAASPNTTSSPPPKTPPGRSETGLAAPRYSVRGPYAAQRSLLTAKRGYRDSITAFMKIAAEIESKLPRLAAPIVARIQEGLVIEIQKHLDENDLFLKRHVVAFPWSNTQFKRRLALLSPTKGRVNRLEHFRAQYRNSVHGLIDVANVIQDMRSPALATIKSMNHRRIELITIVAAIDDDFKMRACLGNYKRYRSRDAVDTVKDLDLRFKGPTTPGLLSEPDGRTGAEVPPATSAKSRLRSAHEGKEGPEGPPVTSGPHSIRTMSFPSIIPLETSVGTTERQQSSEESAITLGTDLVRIKSSPAIKHLRSSFFTSSPERRTKDIVDVVEEPGPPIGKAKDSAYPRDRVIEKDGQKLARQIHTHSRMMKSSHDLQADEHGIEEKKANVLPSLKSSSVKTAVDNAGSSQSKTRSSPDPAPRPVQEVSDQSLLEELFPEISTAEPSRDVDQRNKYRKLDLPEADQLIRKDYVNRPKTLKERVIESFQKSGEEITVLQLEHCSIELTDVDFRRLIPKGDHIESWNREGEYHKIIPGRDPLSLERLPFYYLLFNSPRSAYAYQKNASRLHKLAALHQTTNILSAIPPPRGFLEDGEDIHAATSSYVLKPSEHSITLHTLMQPYHPALRALIEQGGYKPIVPDVDDKGDRIYKVLMHIEGYEPSPSDLFDIFYRDAYKHGVTLSLRNESSSSVHRLRDIINLKTSLQPLSTPRSFSASEAPIPTTVQFDDPTINFLMQGDLAGDGENAKVLNQIVMNRVYNRWLIEFEHEDEARRFAIRWHGSNLPKPGKAERSWKDWEEDKRCNCEFLW